MPIHRTHIFIIASVLCYTPILNAAMFGGIEFPDGEISFADSVISYDPAFSGGNVPTDPNFMDPGAAVGAPDYISPLGSVSLGSGGQLVIRFIDNRLTGSGNADPDLHIFEIGARRGRYVCCNQ